MVSYEPQLARVIRLEAVLHWKPWRNVDPSRWGHLQELAVAGRRTTCAKCGPDRRHVWQRSRLCRVPEVRRSGVHSASMT